MDDALYVCEIHPSLSCHKVHSPGLGPSPACSISPVLQQPTCPRNQSGRQKSMPSHDLINLDNQISQVNLLHVC